MRSSVSTFCKFLKGDNQSNNMRWPIWGAPCKFDNGIALFTYSNISTSLAVCLSQTLKCFHRSDFPSVFGTGLYSISRESGWVVLSRRGISALSDVLSGDNRVYRYEQPKRYAVPVYRHKPPTVLFSKQVNLYLKRNEGNEVERTRKMEIVNLTWVQFETWEDFRTCLDCRRCLYVLRWPCAADKTF